MACWRMPLRWWAATLSPLAFLAVALAVAAAIGKLPRGSDFGRYSVLRQPVESALDAAVSLRASQ